MSRVHAAIRSAFTIAVLLAVSRQTFSQELNVADPGAADRILRGVPGAAAGAAMRQADVGGNAGSDLIVGSPGANGVGRVSIYFGLPAATGQIDLTAGNADATIEGVAVGGGFGRALATGRGWPTLSTEKSNLIVGAPGSTTTAGRVYVFQNAIPPGTLSADASAPSVILVGAVGERFGTAVAAGDLNGDGFDEVIVGSLGTAGSIRRGGRVYVFNLRFHTGVVQSTEADLTLFEDEELAGSGLGEVVEAGFDVFAHYERWSPSTLPDLVLGLPRAYGGRGAVLTIPGRAISANWMALPCTIGTCPVQGLLAHTGEMLIGADAGDRAGQSLGMARVFGLYGPAVRRDLVIGVPGGDGRDNSRPDSGEVYVIRSATLGCLDASPPCRRTLNMPDLAFYGAEPQSSLGEHVIVGDINGDGLSDLLLGGQDQRGVGYFQLLRAPADGFDFWSFNDLTTPGAVDRTLRGSALANAVVWELAGGHPLNRFIASAPSAEDGRGLVYMTTSPDLTLSATTVSVTLSQCAPGARVLEVGNPSASPVVWEARPSDSWIEVVPPAGLSRFGAPALLRIVAESSGRVPGTYAGYVDIVAIRGASRELTLRVDVNMTVTSPAPLARNAQSDFTGDGCADFASMRWGRWQIPGLPDAVHGKAGDWPVPGDYDGDSIAEQAVFRPADGTWYLLHEEVVFGQKGDIPVPADYDGDGTTDIAVYRPSLGRWLIRNQPSVDFGVRGELPVPADYDGDGSTDVAVYMPGAGRWRIRGQGTIEYGLPFDIAVPADYNGDGRADLAVFRRSDGFWYVKDQFSRHWGTAETIPLPLDLTRDGRAELVSINRRDGVTDVYDLATGVAIRSHAYFFGVSVLPPWLHVAMLPVPDDFDGNGLADLLWQRNSSREALVWYNDGDGLGLPTQRNSPLTSFDVAGWTLVGSADFNGDAILDLVWQHDATRRVVVWYLGGTSRVEMSGWRWLAAADVPEWKVVGVGDFNADSHPDLVWQKDVTGQATIWFLRGAGGDEFQGWDWLQYYSAGAWRIVGAADLNLDGYPDLVWQNEESRQVSAWYLGGRYGLGSYGWSWLSQAPVPGWRVVGITDVNGDRVPDLVWQSDEDQTASVWYLGASPSDFAVTLQGYAMLNTFSVAGWTAIPK